MDSASFYFIIRDVRIYYFTYLFPANSFRFHICQFLKGASRLGIGPGLNVVQPRDVGVPFQKRPQLIEPSAATAMGGSTGAMLCAVEQFGLLALAEVPIKDKVGKVLVGKRLHVFVQPVIVSRQLANPNQGVELQIFFRQSGRVLKAFIMTN